VVAAFCAGSDSVSEVRGSVAADGADDPAFGQLLYQLSATLFPLRNPTLDRDCGPLFPFRRPCL
jgi:hypothetical protein